MNRIVGSVIAYVEAAVPAVDRRMALLYPLHVFVPMLMGFNQCLAVARQGFQYALHTPTFQTLH
jgi:hypothetical protein